MNLALRKLAALLVLVPVLWLSLPARAQEATPLEAARLGTTVLKAAHQGAFLPPGTAVVVLGRPAANLRDSLYQPEFVARSAFPRDAALVLRRDTLDGWRQTRTRYPKTQAAGRVYFVYALTPDSTLYWSYSALRDSLKFDVVDRGVMSVAPVPDAATRAAVLAAYFEPQPAEADRVVVYMRGDRPQADSLSAAFRPDSLFTAVLDTPAVVPQVAAPPPSATAPAVRPDQPRARTAGVVLVPELFYGLLVLVLGLVGLVGLLAYFAWTWRRDLRAVRGERLGVWRQQAPRMLLPGDEPDPEANDARQALQAAEQARAEAEQAREDLEQEYAVLKACYDALRRELDLHRAGDGV